MKTARPYSQSLIARSSLGHGSGRETMAEVEQKDRPAVPSMKPTTWPPVLPRLSIEELERQPSVAGQIKGLMPQCSLSVLYGPPGTGKSFLALDWALSVATGRDWLDQESQQCDAIYICGEGAFGLSKRIE